MENLNKRISQLQEEFRQKGIDLCLLLYSRDILYYAGTTAPGVLLITPEKAILFVRRGYEFAKEEATVKSVVKGGSLEEVQSYLKKSGFKKGVMGIELDIIPANLYLKLTTLFPVFQPVNISPIILNQRMVKDSEVLDYMRQSTAIADCGHRRTLEVLKEGMTELELATEVEAALRRNGHEGLLPMRRFDARVLYGFISSGENLTKFPGFVNVAQGIGVSKAYRVSASQREIKRGDLVMVDVTGCYHGYITDIARPYVIGKATEMQKEVFFHLNQVAEKIFDSVRDGLSVKELYSIGLSEAEKTPYSSYFMGYDEEVRGRFIGHGLGLELDEPPILGPEDETIIKENMTFSIEINTIVPQFGAIKIEEDIIVKKKGCELLSRIERKLFEVDRT